MEISELRNVNTPHFTFSGRVSVVIKFFATVVVPVFGQLFPSTSQVVLFPVDVDILPRPVMYAFG